jgi:streptogramin lyase
MPGQGTMYGITPASDGNIWFTSYAPSFDRLGVINPANPGAGVTPITVSSADPWWVTHGPDGAVYWATGTGNSVGRVNASTGAETKVFYGGGNPAKPFAMTTGPEGSLWATEPRDGSAAGLATADKIGLISTTSPPTIANAFSLPSGNADPYGIAVGLGDLGPTTGPSLWATEYTGNRIARLIPVSAGGGGTGAVVKEYLPLPPGSQPYAIALGPDGNMWFTEIGTNKVGRFAPPANLNDPISIQRFDLPAPGQPQAIAAGPDGSMWITQTGGAKIVRMNLAGQVTGEFSIPSNSPNNIVTGADGNLWYTTYDGNKVGRITSGLDAPAFTNPATINVPTVGPVSSSIAVTGLPSQVTDVNVRITGISHTFPDDMDIFLQAPDGRFTMLASDTGSAVSSTADTAGVKKSYPADGVTLSFDDAAQRQLPDQLPLVSGIWRPTNVLDSNEGSLEGSNPGPNADNPPASLAAFNGINPNGTWKLWIDDDRIVDTGKVFGGWGLDIQAVNPPQQAGPTGRRAAALKKCKKKRSKKAKKKCRRKANLLPV